MASELHKAPPLPVTVFTVIFLLSGDGCFFSSRHGVCKTEGAECTDETVTAMNLSTTYASTFDKDTGILTIKGFIVAHSILLVLGGLDGVQR